MADLPKFEDSPGVVVRERLGGTFVAVWQARSDLVKRGYRPVTVPLWRGISPSDADRAFVSQTCLNMQAEMIVWGRDGLPVVSQFDGTIGGLIRCYYQDPDSPFRKLRYQSRLNYRSIIGRIERDHGTEKVTEIRARELMRWHEAWSAKGHTTMAHSLMKALRTVTSFGATILDSRECKDLRELLRGMRFKMGSPRTARLTAEMANAVREVAHKRGLHSIALAQAIQFECMLRQKDIIGEWVPIDEPGLSDVTDTTDPAHPIKWIRGLQWSEIDSNLILRHVTSKRQKEVEVDLRIAGMVIEEFARFDSLPTKNPVIVYEATGLPYQNYTFRRLWREIATEAGVPKDVRNMDSRAGAISEATDAGANLEDVRHAATHSDIAMTQRYSRGSAEKTAKVLQMRANYRKNKSGT